MFDARAAAGISLGLAEQTADDHIAKSVLALLGDAVRRREMRAAGLMTIDGDGAARVASDLASALASRRALKPKQAAS